MLSQTTRVQMEDGGRRKTAPTQTGISEQPQGFFGGLMKEAKRKAEEKTLGKTVKEVKTELARKQESPAARRGTGTGTKKTKKEKAVGTEPPAQTEIPTFESLLAQMLERYAPETVAFTPPDEDALRETIVEWLRPAYEQAIARRREQTEYGNAELDADALARGMGASTYVTDVKQRAYGSEARDVGELEGDYASALAGHLYDAMKSGQEQQIEIERFNAEQRSRAREQATDMALKLYQTYLQAAQEEETAQPTGTGGGSGSGKKTAKKLQKGVDGIAEAYRKEAKKSAKGGSQTGTGVDLKTATELIARLTPQQRSELYAGSGAYAQHRKEILDGIGSTAFAALMQRYPAS